MLSYWKKNQLAVKINSWFPSKWSGLRWFPAKSVLRWSDWHCKKKGTEKQWIALSFWKIKDLEWMPAAIAMGIEQIRLSLCFTSLLFLLIFTQKRFNSNAPGSQASTVQTRNSQLLSVIRNYKITITCQSDQGSMLCWRLHW